MTETKELQIIKTLDEDGVEVELKLLDIVTVDDNDYALLLPVDEACNEDEAEIVLMRLKKDGEEYIFETIEDDEEFEEVAKILNEEYEDECDDENCSCHHHH